MRCESTEINAFIDIYRHDN